MDRVDELVQLVPLTVGEQARLLVAARVVDVHVCHCGGCFALLLVSVAARPRAMGGRLLLIEERPSSVGLVFVWPGVLRVRDEGRVAAGE
jgi:hypothetical protein